MYTKKFEIQSRGGGVLDTRMEPENPTDKYAVCIEKNGNVVGHLSKGNTVASVKRFSFF